MIFVHLNFHHNIEASPLLGLISPQNSLSTPPPQPSKHPVKHLQWE